MKINSFLSIVGSTLVGVGLMSYEAAAAASEKLPRPAYAPAPAPSGRTPAVQNTKSWIIPPNMAEPARLLQQAYFALSLADHDYKGHRVAAMRAVSAAGQHLGMNLRGDGKGREPRALSDKHLVEAQRLIHKARVILAPGPNKKIVRNLDHAIKQINIALSIR